MTNKLCTTHCRFQQVMYNSNTFIFLFLLLGPCRDSSSNSNTGLWIRVFSNANAELNVKGQVTANSNGIYGMYSLLNSNANLEINVESDATLKSCGNGRYDIGGSVPAAATATFLGDGYTCYSNKVVFIGDGNVVPPNCQACPRPP